jgi:hypothetical protein
MYRGIAGEAILLQIERQKHKLNFLVLLLINLGAKTLDFRRLDRNSSHSAKAQHDFTRLQFKTKKYLVRQLG